MSDKNSGVNVDTEAGVATLADGRNERDPGEERYPEPLGENAPAALAEHGIRRAARRADVRLVG